MKPHPTWAGPFEFGYTVNPANGCWEWRQPRNKKGYGAATWEGRQQPAHRVAWQIANGPIPPGMQVCHRCDNPPCVNPAHLFLGTNADNIRDKNAKGRQWRGGNRRKDSIASEDPKLSDDPQRLAARDVAVLAGLQNASITQYSKRGTMPAPDGRIGDTDWWYRKTIEAWLASRPKIGQRGPGRKASD